MKYVPAYGVCHILWAVSADDEWTFIREYPFQFGVVAPTVERRPEEPRVGGSNPPNTTF